MKRITVIGTGYLGAVHAASLASLGYEVLGMDVDAEKIAALAAGRPPFFEPGFDELLSEQVASGRLTFTNSYADVAAFGGDDRANTVHFVCVNTPQRKGEYAADTAYIDSVIDGLAPLLDVPTLIIGKSTVPAGTAARLTSRLRALSPAGDEMRLAWNPEFLREGYAIEDTLRPDRLVIGVQDEESEAALRDVYKPLTDTGIPLLVTDLATSELVKAAANAFLSTKISFINAMAEVCEAAGADVMLLSKALSFDPRIGGRFLVPGLGFGGGCLPKDIRAFMARAGELGADQALAFLKEVDAINMRRRARTVDLAREQCDGSFLGKRIAVWGAAFKPDTDDVRDSPALNVAASILLQGAQVTVYDPKANDTAAKNFPTLNYADSALEAARGANLILHLTEWREFRELDPNAVGEVVAERRVLDGRNALDSDLWRAAGFTYRALGRPSAV
ncbi:UDP-glucose/GDP-mannose dehydrogenase family protein [Actinospica sp. MGRD01-02]|uniref:UDP-glucose 6-dehydrogenase n=1 Tax=Actinospica acidithermotolerans TaxID=2828514 RepID=A0A941EEQ0_9ACTN|nr:UDP-glucose/GDP-mannose dehydrogenase family protein [Actinospica acidithermotolerans]MBR7827694.1 UDP-glucose/GDP-mannose dehydrogenase family protein [Actinospica acidithermotolerans]